MFAPPPPRPFFSSTEVIASGGGHVVRIGTAQPTGGEPPPATPSRPAAATEATAPAGKAAASPPMGFRRPAGRTERIEPEKNNGRPSHDDDEERMRGLRGKNWLRA